MNSSYSLIDGTNPVGSAHTVRARHFFLAPCCPLFFRWACAWRERPLNYHPLGGKVLPVISKALNSGNKDKLGAFIKAHRPDRPDALDRMLDLR